VERGLEQGGHGERCVEALLAGVAVEHLAPNASTTTKAVRHVAAQQEVPRNEIASNGRPRRRPTAR
jgi:hypothetical protein